MMSHHALVSLKERRANMEQTLKLNKQTNLYEASILIQVEPEIFKRMLYRYLEEQNIDPGNIEEYQTALYNVSKVSRWLEHKRVTVVIPEQEPIMLQEPSKSDLASGFVTKRLTLQEIRKLRDDAMALPVDQWDTLLTPLLPFDKPGDNKQERNYVYQRRYDEKKVLDALKKELEPASLQKLEVVASSVNSARMK